MTGLRQELQMLYGVVEEDVAQGKVKSCARKMTHELVLYITIFKGIKCDTLVKRLKQESWAED